MELKERQVMIGEKEVTIPTWNMMQQIDNQPIVFPLVSDAVASAVMVSQDNSEDEEEQFGYFTAALIKSVMQGVTTSDMKQVFGAVLNGVKYRNSNGVPKLLTLESAEKAGFTLSDLYAIAVEVIVENYGPLLKDGFQLIAGVMGSRLDQETDS